MNSSATSMLFGDSHFDVPWFQYDSGEIREVSQCALDFLSNTIGLHGELHDQHGYIVDMASWSALKQYLHWCTEQNIDFMFHADKILEGDFYYKCLGTNTMEQLLAKALDLK